jgi:hypothetical protein
MQLDMAEKTKTATLANPQNPQNIPYGRVLDHLKSRCPDYIPPERWGRTVADSEAFISRWGEQAKALEWTTRDLWGLHKPPTDAAPSYSRLSRYDHLGLCWLLEGREVIALTADSATIRTASGALLTFYRHFRVSSDARTTA